MKDKEYDAYSGDFILCNSLEIIIVYAYTRDESNYSHSSTPLDVGRIYHQEEHIYLKPQSRRFLILQSHPFTQKHRRLIAMWGQLNVTPTYNREND